MSSSFIRTVEIFNFKSIRELRLEGCKRINVFIGEPNVGKSNILEAIGLFVVPQSVKSGLRNFTDFVRFSEVPQLFYNGSFRTSARVVLNNRLFTDLKLQDTQLDISIGDRKALIDLDISKIIEKQIGLYFRASLPTSLQFSAFSISDQVWKNAQVKRYSFDDPKSKVRLNYRDVSLIAPFGNNLTDILFTNQELKRNVQELFRKYQLKITFDQTNNFFRLTRELSDETIFILDINLIADTLRRLVFHLAAIYSNQNSVLLFEEPEAHIFPPYISRLTSEIWGRQDGNQYFIATHSPVVINDFLENAREDTAIFIVTQNDGETACRKLSDAQMDEIYNQGRDIFLNLDYLATG